MAPMLSLRAHSVPTGYGTGGSGPTLVSTRSYDSAGRLYTLGYPSGFTVRYLYNTRGYLEVMRGSRAGA